jgi:hypothetical protein
VQYNFRAKAKAWMLGRRHVASINKITIIGNKITTFGKVGRLETS